MIYLLFLHFYSLVTFLLLPFLFLRLLYKSIKIPSYRQRLLERLGIFSCPENVHNGLWIHSVSVGETVAAILIAKHFLQFYPSIPITITTTTPTGSSRVKQELKDKIFHVYLPYDLPILLSNFFNKVKPRILVIMETELWPNLIHQSYKRKIPVLIANGRISPRSLKGFNRVPFLINKLVKELSFVLAQSELDMNRFVKLGVALEKIEVAGNLKFDIQKSIETEFKSQEFMSNQLNNRPVWIAASTHEGEEEIILQAHKLIINKIPNALLILVPRHPERFIKVKELIKKHNFSMICRTDNSLVQQDIEVFLGDTMGELNFYYGLSQVAFIGGSLVPIGGHNMLEAALYAIPILSGPHLNNFLDISQKLIESEAMLIVRSAQELSLALLQWLEDCKARKQLGLKAETVVLKNQGAVLKIAYKINEFL